MTSRRTFLAAGAASVMALGGCFGGGFKTMYADVIDPEVSKSWRVTSIDVQVPRSLSISEANTYAPDADIVWREERLGQGGDRYQQVDRIITEAATKGASGLRGGKPVKLVLVVTTFHALTEKTRYGLEGAGVHNVQFTAQVVDARTGEALSPVDLVDADLIAYTGSEALASEARGETQRGRIIAHVSNVIAGWLGSAPDTLRGEFSRRGR
ncbi:DUF6778 family protein [Actibacterium sp. XHP0104]|uniref:DUF6778 family protein n=1 Tax=Actibacterium sp. XHP0104 TaxID=2984335 RepID=UPI0021E90306|nr:DUF6778 family protein [Actibacterium sp. XHP0104]MCV2881180.1 hypothetical protein [Actibacterium sp. XHP0104]